MDKKVSVVIAVYNGVPYIRRAIDSALAQTYPIHEVIVIDDGSFDGTPELLKSYGSRIHMRRFTNGGVATAMNRGLELATGDYVAFLDHDDVWFRHKIQRQVEELLKHPEAQFACCNYAVRPPGMGGRLMAHISAKRPLEGQDPGSSLLTNALGRLIDRNFVGTSSAVLVSREVTQKVGLFNKNYRITGDYDYWLRCAALTGVVVVPEMVFYKRTHATNISAARTRTLLEHVAALEDFARVHGDTLDRQGLRDVHKRALVRLHYQLGHYHLEEKNDREAFASYRRALRAEPSLPNSLVYLWTVSKKSIRRLLLR